MHAWLNVFIVLITAAYICCTGPCARSASRLIRTATTDNVIATVLKIVTSTTTTTRRQQTRRCSSSGLGAVVAYCSMMVVMVAVSADTSIDPVALAAYEKNLFAQLGLTKRPKIIDRANIVIPDELMETYHKMMAGHEHSDSVALPTPGVHTKSANTIRSYGHEG